MSYFNLLILKDYQIIEGIVASIIFPFFVFYFRNVQRISKYTLLYLTMLGWYITWIFRKMSVNLYLKLKKDYNFVGFDWYI